MSDVTATVPLSFASLQTDHLYITLVEQQCRATLDGQAERFLSDAMQDTWAKAQRAMQEGQEIRHPESWLRTVAHHASIDLLRRRNDGHVALDEQPIPDPRSPFPSVEARVDFHRMYQMLLRVLPTDDAGQRQRNILRYVLEGKKQIEIAAVLQVSPSLVTKDLQAIKKWVAALEQTYQQFTKTLTKLQQKLLYLARQGKRNHEIAQQVGLSPHRVKQELQVIIRRLHDILTGPWDGGGGGAPTRTTEASPQEACQGDTVDPSSGEGRFISFFLQLPAFQNLPDPEETAGGGTASHGPTVVLSCLARLLLDLPALQEVLSQAASGTNHQDGSHTQRLHAGLLGGRAVGPGVAFSMRQCLRACLKSIKQQVV